MSDTIFGLPTHVLVVHAAVVLLPLAALGAIVMSISQRFSIRFGPIVVAVAAVGTVSAFMSRISGEEFAERVGNPEEHAEAGAILPFIAAGFFIALLLLWLLDRRGARDLLTQIVAVVVIVAALITIGWTIRTGHSGAEASWKAIIDNTQPG
jgi:cell division protein FtsW (lipid II flippase)